VRCPPVLTNRLPTHDNLVEATKWAECESWTCFHDARSSGIFPIEKQFVRRTSRTKTVFDVRLLLFHDSVVRIRL